MGIDLAGARGAEAAMAEGDKGEELQREIKEDSWGGVN